MGPSSSALKTGDRAATSALAADLEHDVGPVPGREEMAKTQSFKSPAIAAAIAGDSCWRGKQLNYAGFCAKKSWPLIALFSWQ